MILLHPNYLNALCNEFDWFSGLGPDRPNIIANVTSSELSAIYFIDAKKWKKPTIPDLPVGSVVVTNMSANLSKGVEKVFIAEPWLEFSRISQVIRRVQQDDPSSFDPAAGAHIGAGVNIPSSTFIGPGAVVSPGASLGENCRIGSRAVIMPGVIIGDGCTIHAGALVGVDGFGYADGQDGESTQIAHLGGIELAEHVDVGPGAVICAGTIDPTRIGKGTKIDGQVYIGHNVQLGERCMICAHAIIGGSAIVGNDVWIHTGAGLKSKVRVADNAVVGLGAAVIKSVEAGSTVMGDVAEDVSIGLRRKAALGRIVRDNLPHSKSKD